MGTKLSQQPQNKPTFLEQIGTLIFHIRERSRLAAKRAFNPPAATVSTARQGDIVGQFLIQTKTDYIQRYQRAGEFFEASELELIRQHFNGGTYIDVGANIGNHAVYFGQLPNCSKVLAFEPNPASLRLLKINVLLNHLDEKIEVHPYALGQSDTQKPSLSPAAIWAAPSSNMRAVNPHRGQNVWPFKSKMATRFCKA